MFQNVSGQPKVVFYTFEGGTLSVDFDTGVVVTDNDMICSADQMPILVEDEASGDHAIFWRTKDNRVAKLSWSGGGLLFEVTAQQFGNDWNCSSSGISSGADIDGDGDTDLVFLWTNYSGNASMGDKEGGYVEIIDFDLNHVDGWPFTTGYTSGGADRIDGTPLVWITDNDGGTDYEVAVSYRVHRDTTFGDQKSYDILKLFTNDGAEIWSTSISKYFCVSGCRYTYDRAVPAENLGESGEEFLELTGDPSYGESSVINPNGSVRNYVGETTSYNDYIERIVIDGDKDYYLAKDRRFGDLQSTLVYEINGTEDVDAAGARAFVDLDGDGWVDPIIVTTSGLKVFMHQGGSSPATYNSFAKCVSPGLSDLVVVPLLGTSCKVEGGVTGSDVNKDYYYDELISGAGIVDFRTRSILKNFTDNAVVIPIDIDYNTYGDFFEIHSAGSTLYKSVVEPEVVIPSTSVEIKRLQPCVVGENGLAQVGVVGTGASVENITYYVDWGDGFSETHPYGDGSGYLFEHLYRQSGTYTVSARMCDYFLGECDDETCTLIVNVTDTRAGYCTWYQAGSFDYVDDVEEYDWFVSPTTKILKPEDGLLKFTDGLDTEMLHTASCNQVGIKVSFKFYTDADGEFIITIGGDGGALASLKFRSGEILSYTSRNYVVVGNYSVNQWNVYKLAIDSSTNTFYIMDESDNIIFSDSLLRTVSDMYEAYVKLSYYSGNVYIDYIDLEGFGGIAFVSLEQDIANMTSEYSCSEDASILDQCSASTELFFQAKRQGVPEQSYHNVNQFCSSCGKSGGTCDYSMLKRILNYNQDCYKEVMNYCVDVTYPRYTLKKDPSSGSVKEGTVVCSSVLGIYTASDKFIVPIFTTVWSVIKANFIYFAIVIIIVVVILAIFANRK